MSRYRPDPYYAGGDQPYRDPPPQRWDSDRFARERDYRAAPIIDQRQRPDDHRAGPPRRQPVYEEERYVEDDRHGPRGVQSERRYFEDEEVFNDPRASRGQIVPFRPERPPRPEAPPRPGVLRRQSSLDTFDRQPARRYQEYGEYQVERAPPARVSVPVPPAPSPRRYPKYPYDERDYADIRVQDPDYYGDDGFREYREREWVTRRRRNSSDSRSRERVREEIVDEVKVEKPYPRRGKTRMPKRLVRTKVLYDMGYPFYEEDDRTILIQLALGPENIDEVITRSKEYRDRETMTTRLIEAPPAESSNVREERIVQEVKTIPLSEAPRSVREWDALTARSPSPKSHRSRSRRRSRHGSSPVVKETTYEKKVIEREVSPARTAKTSASFRRASSRRRASSSSSRNETVIEKTKIIRQDDIDESNSVHVGPLALVVDRRPPRTERDIKDEIRQLEAERRALRRERRYENDGTEIVKVERIRERSPSPHGEVIVERRGGEEILEVKKDRRGRSRSAAPTPGMIRAMMTTLT